MALWVDCFFFGCDVFAVEYAYADSMKLGMVFDFQRCNAQEFKGSEIGCVMRNVLLDLSERAICTCQQFNKKTRYILYTSSKMMATPGRRLSYNKNYEGTRSPTTTPPKLQTLHTLPQTPSPTSQKIVAKAPLSSPTPPIALNALTLGPFFPNVNPTQTPLANSSSFSLTLSTFLCFSLTSSYFAISSGEVKSS